MIEEVVQTTLTSSPPPWQAWKLACVTQANGCHMNNTSQLLELALIGAETHVD